MELTKEKIKEILIEIQKAKDGAIKMIELMRTDPELKDKLVASGTKDKINNSDYGLLLDYCSKAEAKIKKMKDNRSFNETPEDFLNSFNAYNDGGLELTLIRETKALLSLMDELKKMQN